MKLNTQSVLLLSCLLLATSVAEPNREKRSPDGHGHHEHHDRTHDHEHGQRGVPIHTPDVSQQCYEQHYASPPAYVAQRSEYQDPQSYLYEEHQAAPSNDTPMGPPANESQPAPNYSPPAPEYSAPAPEYSPPAPDYSSPAPQYSPPAPAYSPPAPAYSPPASYSPPAPAYSPPAPAYSPPASYSPPAPDYSPSAPQPYQTQAAPSYNPPAPTYISAAAQYTPSYVAPQQTYEVPQYSYGAPKGKKPTGSYGAPKPPKAPYKILRWATLLYATSTFNYFSDQGIPGPKPIPIFGNMWGVWKENLPEYDIALVKKYGKVFGYFDGPIPNLVITDVDMIKAMFVKDFDHFADRRSFEMKSKVMRKWLSLMKGQEWKDIRSSVTPAFTSGKIKRMSGLIKDCIGDMCDRVTIFAEKDGKIDAKQVFSVFTMDVIARCAFGLKIDTLGSENDPFVKNAQYVLNPPSYKSVVSAIPFMYPELFSTFGYFTERLIVTEEMKFFFKLLENVLKDRSQSDKKFNDFIEAADEAISGYTKIVDGKTVPMWTREDIDEIIIGQSTLFLLAGFDTTATTMTSACFQLARNPDIQEKLYESIAAKMAEYDEVCHEVVQSIPYLEMVIQEVLRYYPPLIRVERECTKDYSYDNGRIKMKKGYTVSIPTYALHHMEEYYPDPEKFDPERWSPENKAKRSAYTYLAFGTGPRNCVGMRFAMEELKMALFTLVQKFRFYPVEETLEKLQFDDGLNQLLQPIQGIVGVELRQSNSN
uniref:Cytochrome P450 n=1 Tax=Daphnia galeata TaxID=27404 RepID=A0A8J2RTT3_9CRUS|nr:unnamed protein product [Daphnia galeata]